MVWVKMGAAEGQNEVLALEMKLHDALKQKSVSAGLAESIFIPEESLQAFAVMLTASGSEASTGSDGISTSGASSPDDCPKLGGGAGGRQSVWFEQADAPITSAAAKALSMRRRLCLWLRARARRSDEATRELFSVRTRRELTVWLALRCV